MARNKKSRPQKQSVASKIFSLCPPEGGEEFFITVSEALDHGLVDDSVMRSITRAQNKEKAALCLHGIYMVASTLVASAKKEDGEMTTVTSHLFSVTVSGDETAVVNRFVENLSDVTKVFRTSGLFKEESNVILFGTPYSLSDVTKMTPKISREICEIMLLDPKGLRNFPMPLPEEKRAVNGDTTRTYFGVYYYEGEPEDLYSMPEVVKEYGFPERDKEYNDAQDRYQAAMQEILGDDVYVSMPSPLNETFASAMGCKLDDLEQLVDASFFSGDVEITTNDGFTTFMMHDGDGAAVSLRVPEIMGVMGLYTFYEWLLDHNLSNVTVDFDFDDEERNEETEFSDNIIDFPGNQG